jgi:hypothetical protein
MENKRTPIIVSVSLALVLIALFAWPKINNPHRGLVAQFNKAGIECMGGHARAVQHFHPHLTILVDGQEESIPANLGLIGNCMAEIHTHDATGALHVEAAYSTKTFYLKNFFSVYGKTLEREGYEISMTVDDQSNTELGELVLKDKQQIVLEYKKLESRN